MAYRAQRALGKTIVNWTASYLSPIYPSRSEGKRDMNQWVLTCSTCGKEFTHSSIPENLRLTESYLPTKPEFPPNGVSLDCPHCEKSGTYQRSELRCRGPKGH